MEQLRQGDVFLVKIDSLPADLKEKDKVLALGETTGHKHQFLSSQVQVFADKQGQQFVNVKESSILQHEEHGHLQVPQGQYKVIIQREYDILEGIRKVMD